MTDLAHPGSIDPRPAFRVAAFGLTHRLQRVLEIVLRHARHNQYRYTVAATGSAGDFDIALVDMTSKDGYEAANSLRRQTQGRAVITLGRRLAGNRQPDDLQQDAFIVTVLRALNGVVQQQGLSPAGGASEPAEVQPSAQPEVLLIDDSTTVQHQVSLAIAQLGVEVTAVGSAAEALELLQRRRFDLIIADVMMEGMDGFQLTREIKRNRALKGIPLVLLTSRSSPIDLARGALAGCNSYLVKPVPPQSLRQTVMRHLGLQPGHRLH